MLWALERNVFNFREKLLAQQAKNITAIESLRSRKEKKPVKIVDGTAYIPVVGVLTTVPDFLCCWFGMQNTLYGDLIEKIMMVDADADVKKIVLTIDSPGGEAVSDWLTVMQTVAATTKPTVAWCNMAASAAYGIASQCDSISAWNAMGMFGSIGVVASYLVDDEIVEITSGNAPKKRPDVTTEEGRKIVREEINQIETIFIDTVAKGRQTNREDVVANFGEGGSMLSQQALKKGLIDRIGIQMEEPEQVSETDEGEDKDMTTMISAELRQK